MAGKSRNLSFSFSDAEMPVRFGRYLLLRRKGVETVGEHFLAIFGVEEGFDQLRLVRAIYPAVAEDRDFVAMFTEEARSLSQLSSSNVVRIIELGQESGIPFTAQEHVEGITLNKLLSQAEEQNVRCHWELAAHIAAEMLRGLDHVHRREDIRGIPLAMRHGDVRPQNVLVSFNGEVKLANFSSSLYYMINEATNAKFETERGIFAPPEGRRIVTHGATVANDLWGASMTLLALLEGASSLKQISATASSRESLTSVAYRIRGVPKRINLLLARALHSDPKHRFENAASMRDTLLEIIKESSSGHPPDDLAAFVRDVTRSIREEEEHSLRKIIRRDASMSLDESAKLGKIVPGIILDRKYRLLKLLGEGGMGRVFEAEHMGIEKRVAVKVLHERELNDKTAVERFRREAKIMGGLGHPNIVDVSDYGVTSEGNYYLVMELLEGDTLGALIDEKGGTLSSLEIVDIMIEVCKALTAAHTAGVVHRDLKPDNIFLTPDGPRIVDFGIAKRSDLDDAGTSLTKPGNVCGTVEYIAPEQISNRPVDHRADVYSCGIIIYESLTGVTPFKGKNALETMHRAASVKVVPPRKRADGKNIPKALEALCLKAMQRDPSRRFETAEEMRICLEDVRQLLFSPSDEAVKKSSARQKLRNIFVAVFAFTVMIVAPLSLYVLNESRQNDVSSTEERASEVPVATPTQQRSHSSPAVKTPPEAEETQNPRPLREPASALKTKNPSTDGDKDAERVEKLLLLGEKALKRMALKDAAHYFKLATQKDPTDSRGWYGQGRTAFEQNRPTKAVAMIQKALRLNPGKYKWRIFLGKVHMASGQRDRAVREWRRVLSTRSNNTEARRLLEAAGEEL